MRVHWRHAERGKDFPPVWKIRDLNTAPMSDNLMETLATAGLTSLTLEFADFSRTQYRAIEYPCTYCGSYEHADGYCEPQDAPWEDDGDIIYP